MQIMTSIITKHEMLCDNMLTFKVKTEKNSSELGLPGQFYQIKVPGDDFQIRVPISIYDVEDSEITFLVKIVGEKTIKLKNMQLNDELSIIGPLGNSFAVSEKEKYMFISGGCGYAPLNFLFKSLTKNNNHQSPNEKGGKILWIHGGRTKDEVKFAVDGKKVQIICTDDGSEGIKGFVTSEVSKELYIQSYDKVFACGPDPMLREVMSVCKLFNKKLYVSMEAYMGCGIGVCYGCAIKLRNARGKYTYARICKEGPIFNAYSIVWEEIIQ
ncbi:MAG: dihydroorotate dehydrogenase electron transfer subunit [Candidatus Cloacimonetes bacterium]|nr:dihydroorotate dehydrogenase electron transfer subunit [Candidatus Cloacimonadota bacterium]